MRYIAPLLAFCMLFVTSVVHAQAWPTKPVRWIVPFPPGGASDIATRIIGDKLSALWGQPVVLDNKPGAGGTIATAELIRSTDGHTVMIGTLGTHGIAPNLYKNLSYEAGRDLTPVAMLIQSPMVLVASPTLPAKALSDVVSLARANPDKYSIASPGNGTLNHLMAEMFKQSAKVKMEHIPYKGSAPAYADLISGRTALMFDPIAGVLPQIKSGNLKAIAITQRSTALPGVPTLAEAGFSNFDVGLWLGLFAPASTPPVIVSKISADVVQVLKSPEVIQQFDALSAQVVAMPNEQFSKVYAGELSRWGKVIRDLNVKID